MRYLLREDLEKLRNPDEDARFLGRTDIEAIGQLDAFRHITSRAIEELVAERQPLYRIARNPPNPNVADEARTRIAVINEQLKQYRKQITQCDRIAERSQGLAEKIIHIEEVYENPTPKRNTKTRSRPEK